MIKCLNYLKHPSRRNIRLHHPEASAKPWSSMVMKWVRYCLCRPSATKRRNSTSCPARCSAACVAVCVLGCFKSTQINQYQPISTKSNQQQKKHEKQPSQCPSVSIKIASRRCSKVSKRRPRVRTRSPWARCLACYLYLYFIVIL